jgi:hypothetical protein
VGDSINHKDLDICLVDESEAEHRKLQESGSVTKEKQTHQVLKLKSMTDYLLWPSQGQQCKPRPANCRREGVEGCEIWMLQQLRQSQEMVTDI